jgi:hypothetical protein
MAGLNAATMPMNLASPTRPLTVCIWAGLISYQAVYVYVVKTKIILPLLAVLLLAACVLTGCQSPKARSPSRSSASTRNNCYSLLHQLLDEQKDVSMLRFIKPEHTDVKNLVKRIATTSGTGSDLAQNLRRATASGQPETSISLIISACRRGWTQKCLAG